MSERAFWTVWVCVALVMVGLAIWYWFNDEVG